MKARLFDLDDTLIDTQGRHYHVYCTFMKSIGEKPIALPLYVALRKQGQTNKQIIDSNYHSSNLNFHDYWMSQIESSDILKLDKPLVDYSLLKELKSAKDEQFIILSLRTNKVTAMRQFKSFSFAQLFDDIFFLPHSNEGNPKSKIIEHLCINLDISSFIGDSLSDQQAAFDNDVVFQAVSTGWQEHLFNNSFPDINQLLVHELGK
jgi:phosphoglycolate phosphatase-like HAD superfamily hydrolase